MEKWEQLKGKKEGSKKQYVSKRKKGYECKGKGSKYFLFKSH